MQTLLQQLNAVPGVAGSMVSDAEGRLVAHAFPPAFEPATLRAAARVLADSATGLATATGAIGLVDLRFAESRIVVKPLAGAHLLFLCSPTANLQPLVMSAAVAANRIERLLAGRPPPTPAPAGAPPAPAPAEPPAGGMLLQVVQRIDAAIARKKLDRFKVRGAIALQAGIGLGFIDADTPDDPATLARLRAAAAAVLGEAV